MRLALALLAPTALVGIGLHGLGDARLTFLLYIFGGCAVVPWLLLGIRPLSTQGALPLRAPRERLWSLSGLPLALVLFGPVFFVLYALMRGQISGARTEKQWPAGVSRNATPLLECGLSFTRLPQHPFPRRLRGQHT